MLGNLCTNAAAAGYKKRRYIRICPSWRPLEYDIAVTIGKTRTLYRIESKIEDLAADEKKASRQQFSKPVLDGLNEWLKTNQERVPADSLTRTAINHMLNQWDRLVAYCEDGRLNISNALAENAIRPFTVGRRNGLFSGTPGGAAVSATCFTLIETAKANGLEALRLSEPRTGTYRYCDPLEKVEALLP